MAMSLNLGSTFNHLLDVLSARATSDSLACMGLTAKSSAFGRVTLFLSVGVLFFLRWRQVGSVDYVNPVTVSDWLAVVGFSTALLFVAVALPVYAGLTEDRATYRISLVPAIGLTVASVANLVEDGWGWSGAFWPYVLSSIVYALGLIALTFEVARKKRGIGRIGAVVPAGTLLGLVFFESWGGPVLLLSWFAAALVALSMRNALAKND